MRTSTWKKRAAWCLAAAATALGLGSTAQAQVKISQVYGGGGNAAAIYTNDFIEIYNTGAPQLLTGWSVQYASATGTTWSVTNLPAVTLGTGQYLLIQEAVGTSRPAGQGLALPTPDATGTIAMAAGDFKVALVNSTTALTGATPTGAQIQDLVGCGTTTTWNEPGATFSAANNAPAGTNTYAVFRNGCGASDTNNNAADFGVGIPSPRNTATAVNAGMSGSGMASPYLVKAGQTTRLTFAPRLCSTGFPVAGTTTVTVNATALGGLGSVGLVDDGTSGDDVANDGIYSLLITVPAATVSQSYALPVTFTDGTNSGGAYIGLFVTPAATPANDNARSAQAIVGPYTTPVDVSGTFTGASVEYNPITTLATSPTGGMGDKRGLWFTVLGSGNTLTASLCPTTPALDSIMLVMCGTPDGLTVVANGDDNGPACTGTAASASWCSTAGQTYYVWIAPFATGASTAAYTLRISDNATACTGAVACTNCTLTKPALASAENENPYGPATNDGCDSTPNKFTDVTVSTTPLAIYGTLRGYAESRDTDWFRFQASASDILGVSVTSNHQIQVSIRQLGAGGICTGATTLQTSASSARCGTTTVNQAVTAGTWYAVRVIHTPTPAQTGGVDVGGTSCIYTGTLQLGVPTPPTCTLASSPTSVVNDGTGVINLTVTVTPGTNPPSTAHSVTANLTNVGGGAAVAMTEGPANTFTLAYTVPNSVTTGSKSITTTVQETAPQARSSTCNTNVTVYAYPAVFTDLGTLQTFGSDLTQNLTLAAGEIKWFKVVTPIASNPNTYLDLWTNAGGAPALSSGDSEIGIYDNTGNFVATNDDGGPGSYSCLSYGRTTTPPTRSRDGSEVTLGTNGTLAAGTYWIAVGAFNTTFNTTGFSVTSASTATGNVVLRVNYGDITVTPTPPTITASGATPAGPHANGDSILLTATVAPGTNPASTGIVVTGNLTAIGGSSTQLFFDDASNGDVTANDGIYSFQATIVGASAGNAACLITAQDAQMRSGTATINVSIALDLGTYSTPTTTMLNLPLSGSGIYWVKFTVPAVTTTAGNWLDITTDAGTAPGTLTDGEIGIYTSAGNLVASDDDDGNGNYSELSFGATTPTRTTLTGATGGNGRDGTLAAGTYYMALGVFNVTFNASGFSVTSTGTASGDVKVRFDYAPIPPTTNPTGVGSSSPSTVNNCGTNSTTLTVVVTPGTGPTSTAHTVTADLSTIGGSPTQAFVEGPANTFTFSQLIANSVTTGAKTLPFTVQETAPNSRSSTGNISVTIAGCPPVNDECAGAIAAFAGTTSFDNTAATSGTDAAASCPSSSGHSVWYSYTPTCSGVVTISTCGGTTVDTVLTAYADCTAAAAGTELACNDDFCSLQSTITVTGTAGVPFIIRLAGWSTSNGTGTFSISEAVIAPSITAQPSGGTICEGAAFGFSVTASGSSLSYQWRKGGVDIGGATGASYNIAAATLADAGSYDCVVSNACGSVTSSAASLAVNANTVITSNPVNAKVCDGNDGTFSVVASGSNLTYQWRKDGVDIGGATSASYMTGLPGAYDCVVSGDCGSATSSAATLEVNAITSITSNPSGGSVCAGGTFNFGVSAEGKNLTYQWRKDGNDILGATGASYSVINAAAGDAGSYDCFVGGDCGNATSSAAALVVNFAPAITSDPMSASVCAGDPASFSVSASGSPAPSYQWRFNGTDIMGANGSSYSIPAANLGDAGSYDCVVTNVCGSATSGSATLSVNVGPSITTQPSNQSGAVGSNASFSVVATGSGPLSYQWRKNTVDLVDGGSISGATTATLSVGPLALSDAGSYDVVITNACGSVTSDAATLTVTGCVADVDDGSGTGTPDGGVTIDDLLYYLYIFELGSLAADVDDGSGTGTLDGGVTIDDLLYFLYRFELGC